MIFIINLFGLIAVGFILGVCLGLNYLWPNLLGSTYGDLIIGAVTFVIGTGLEIFGVKGRVLFMPVWLLGILMIGYQLFVLFGFLGVVGALCLVSLAIFVHLKVSHAQERKRWAEAQRRILELPSLTTSPDRQSFWKCVKDTCVLPTNVPFDSSVASHHRTVLRYVLEATDAELDSTDRELLRKLDAYVTEAVTMFLPPKIDLTLRRSAIATFEKVYSKMGV